MFVVAMLQVSGPVSILNGKKRMTERDEGDIDHIDATRIETWTSLGEVTRGIVVGCRPTQPPSDAAWGGNLTPTPLSELERSLLTMLSRTMDQPEALRAAIRRFGFIREAHGLGLGMDPDIVRGVEWWLDALIALETRTSRADHAGPFGRPRRRARHVRLNRGRASTASEGSHIVGPFERRRRPLTSD